MLHAGKKRGAKELSLSLFANGSGAPLAFLANLVLARLLGPDAYGNYMAILSAGLVAGGVAVFGTGTLLTREIAASTPDEQFKAAQLIGGWALKFTTILTFLILLGLLLWLIVGAAGAPITNWPERIAISGLVWVSVWVVLVAGILGGLGQVAKSQFIVYFLKNGLLLLGAIVVSLYNIGATVSTVLGLQVLAYSGAALMGVWWIYNSRRTVGDKHHFRDHDHLDPSQNSRGWLRSSRHFFVGSAATMLLARLDVLIVNGIGGVTAAGLFAAGARLGQIGIIVGTVWSAWLQPRMAYQVRKGDIDAVLRTLRIGLAGTLSMTGVSFLVGWVFAPWLMSLLGPGFSEAVQPFRWILIGCFLWSPSVPFYVFLNMSGHEMVVARIRWVQLGATVALSFPLVKSFGALGGAWAWAAGMGVTSAITIIIGILNIRAHYLAEAVKKP